MTSTVEAIAAYIGAAAWLPQVSKWIYNAAVKPTLTVIPNPSVSVGFTTLGPICNLQLAIAVDRRDVIITKLRVSLTHDNGEKHELSWRGMTETFSTLRDRFGIEQGSVEKEQAAIALKVTTYALTDKFFKFQEDKFHTQIGPALQEAIKHQNFLMSKKSDYHDEFLKSEKFHILVEGFKPCFWWQSGKYKMEFSAESTAKLRIAPHCYVFELTQSDVDALSGNIGMVKQEYEVNVKHGLPGYETPLSRMAWRNIPVKNDKKK